ncbi:tetraacyldisaccharide 4'-kinase [Neptuniibacter caesariensis]|uniref:Tetraacyldisaccharide 4'-kinase n=1 Tax=Neptuniibacter caesariensis TaxID=207954 RepID=A0A7U8C980_NEPCE|nr:tetraacyldisaccharide 4'-kinase [Neptuniibacter caesariensis]EAR62134.1 Tetraacyldisaccharide-1-P 4'-kinase [Oceanospirillum sp. MED92] [Neptuniibacter caesariensis]
MSWLEQRWYSDKPGPWLLKPLTCIYRFLSEKKKLKDQQRQWHAPVPVIIVGNISVGGTGKTPFTVFLVDLLRSKGYAPGIISRGYKSKAPEYPFDVSKARFAEEAGDEPFMLHQRCECPVVIDPDRTSAAQYLLEQYKCDVIISDDGLQHYKLGRDIEIAVIDGVRGLGNKELLPCGPLRELPSRLNDVDYIVANGRLADLNLEAKQHLMQLEPYQFKAIGSDESVSVTDWVKRKVHAVAGIGNPQRFFETLNQDLGIETVDHPKPDHHQYTIEDFEFADKLPVVMTEKDAVKAAQMNLDDAWYLKVHAKLDEDFASDLLQQLQRTKKV